MEGEYILREHNNRPYITDVSDDDLNIILLSLPSHKKYKWKLKETVFDAVLIECIEYTIHHRDIDYSKGYLPTFINNDRMGILAGVLQACYIDPNILIQDLYKELLEYSIMDNDIEYYLRD